MAELSDLIIPGVLLVGGYLVLTRLMSQANQAGKWVAENVIQPATTAAKYPTAAGLGLLEGYAAPEIPQTPAGYRPSNWSWQIGNGVVLGLPEGMTPGQFCAQSPGSPVCSQVKAKPSILGDWYNLVW